MQPKTYSPTEAVMNNIQRGVALKKKYNRDSVVAKMNTEVIQKAKSNFDSGFTLETIKKMYSELSALEPILDIKKRLIDGGPSEELIKFYAFGGQAGLAWTRMILKEEGILKSYNKPITENEINQVSSDQVGQIKVAKAVDKELMQATFVVMVPEEIDLHGDVTSEDEIRKACHSFNKFCRKANLFHMVETDTFEIVESWITPVEFVLEDKFIKKGTWLCTIQVNAPELWSLIKAGDIKSVSIGAMAKVENLEEETD